MCITLLALYQATVSQTPVIGGLFAPAVIMFLYVFWVLYTANNNKKRLKKMQQEREESTVLACFPYIPPPSSFNRSPTRVNRFSPLCVRKKYFPFKLTCRDVFNNLPWAKTKFTPTPALLIPGSWHVSGRGENRPNRGDRRECRPWRTKPQKIQQVILHRLRGVTVYIFFI